jgi:hypothetical protein
MQYGLIKKMQYGPMPRKGPMDNCPKSMSLHNAIWAKFVKLTRAQNKIAQYSVQQTFRNGQKITQKPAMD